MLLQRPQVILNFHNWCYSQLNPNLGHSETSQPGVGILEQLPLEIRQTIHSGLIFDEQARRPIKAITQGLGGTNRAFRNDVYHSISESPELRDAFVPQPCRKC